MNLKTIADCGWGLAIVLSRRRWVMVACDRDIKNQLGLNKLVVPVANTRNLSKRDMKLNDLLPNIEADPETYEARANGKLLTC